MARALRWTVPFMSLNGTYCHIDIYDEGWQGGITTLSSEYPSSPGVAAPDPFYYEEDNDSDLLHVIRVKTGYINLIETSFGALTELYPETDKSHYVEFYYGSRLDFIGYMQAQVFDNNWAAGPRLISFPVQSPLGLLGTHSFSFTAYSSLYLKDCLNIIKDGLGVGYTQYLLPTDASFEISTYLLCPFRENPTKADGSDQYNPMTYYEFLVGVCNLHGLVLHDTPDALIFSRYDYSGDYIDLISTSHFDAGFISSVSSYFSEVGTNGKISLVKPLGKITVKYQGGNIFSCSVSASHMVPNGISEINRTEGTPMFWGAAVAWLKMFSPEFSSSYMLATNSLTNGLMPTDKGVIGAVINDKECVVVYCNSSMNLNSNKIMEWNIAQYPGFAGTGQMIINIKVKEHTTINDEGTDSNPFYISIDVDNEYYNNTDYQFDSTVHKYAVSGGQFRVLANIPESGVRLRVTLWGSSLCTNGKLFTIDEMNVELQPVKLYQYREAYSNERIIDGDANSEEEGDVQMILSRDRYNANSLFNVSLGGYTAPAYPYLMLSQNHLRMNFTGTLPSLKDLYLYRWTYTMSCWGWRILAFAFHPWDDEYRLSMQHSTVND